MNLINFILIRKFKLFTRMAFSSRIRQLATSIILMSLFVFIILTSSNVHVLQINMDLRIVFQTLHNVQKNQTLNKASIVQKNQSLHKSLFVQKNQSLTDVGLFNYNNIQLI